MKLNKNLCAVAATTAALLGAGAAGAVPVVSDGVWTALDPAVGVANVTGLNTNRVSWGEPGFDRSSAFVFDGASVDAPLDGSLFALGDFTHENFPIFPPAIQSADLGISIDFVSEGINQMFNYTFELDETPNITGSCVYPGITVCPDRVTIPNASSTETVELGGIEYVLAIVGFSTDGGTTITDGFITEEDSDNVATLYARLVEHQVPEPGVLSLIGLGLIAFGVKNRKRA